MQGQSSLIPDESGTSGKTHSDRNETRPATAATGKASTMGPSVTVLTNVSTTLIERAP
jgi:hypothetical protein